MTNPTIRDIARLLLTINPDETRRRALIAIIAYRDRADLIELAERFHISRRGVLSLVHPPTPRDRVQFLYGYVASLLTVTRPA